MVQHESPLLSVDRCLHKQPLFLQQIQDQTRGSEVPVCLDWEELVVWEGKMVFLEKEKPVYRLVLSSFSEMNVNQALPWEALAVVLEDR